MLSPTTYRICEEFDLPKDIVDRQACSEPAFATSGLPLVTSAPPPPPALPLPLPLPLPSTFLHSPCLVYLEITMMAAPDPRGS